MKEKKREYSETFAMLSENICYHCISSKDSDMCECFDHMTCPYWGEMEDLHELCVKADALAKSILDSASTRSADDVYREGYLAYLGV